MALGSLLVSTFTTLLPKTKRKSYTQDISTTDRKKGTVEQDRTTSLDGYFFFCSFYWFKASQTDLKKKKKPASKLFAIRTTIISSKL